LLNKAIEIIPLLDLQMWDYQLEILDLIIQILVLGDSTNRPRATTTSLGQRLHPSLHWKINRSVKCLFKERWCRNLDF
jgi:hypothetical protein